MWGWSPKTVIRFLQQILQLRHPGIIMLLDRVWVVRQQHGNMVHADMLLQKFDGKGVSEHVLLGPDALAVAVFEIERGFHQLPNTAQGFLPGAGGLVPFALA